MVLYNEYPPYKEKIELLTTPRPSLALGGGGIINKILKG